MATIYIGQVISINDEQDGERIQARLKPADNFRKDKDVPFAFPLLPKMLHVKPKVGEAVAVICADDENPRSQRYYLGPIISQMQYSEKDNYFAGATTMLKGGLKKPDVALSNQNAAIGALAKDDDIAIYGRKNTDIILSDNDIRIRCGVRLTDGTKSDKVEFNKNAPAFIKLKYYDGEPLKQDNPTNGSHATTKSTVTIFGDKINLLSPSGDPNIDISDKDENISDEEMKKIIDNCHLLPYGDILVNFLHAFYKMFKNHTHKYDNLPPCPDVFSNTFEILFGTEQKDFENKLLSKDIRIN